MVFRDLTKAVDDAVEAHLCDDAKWRRKGETVWQASPVRVAIETPTNVETLQNAKIVLARPVLSVRVASLPDLAIGWRFALSGRVYGVCAKPTRPDDGAWWNAEIEEVPA